MPKFLNLIGIRIIAYFIIGALGVVLCYQIWLFRTYKGNLLIHMEYSGDSNDECIDFLVKINGKNVFEADSIGMCKGIYSVDTILCLPIGINLIEINSAKLNLRYNDKIFNLFYMYLNVDVLEYYKDNYLDIKKEINVRYGYGRLKLL